MKLTAARSVPSSTPRLILSSIAMVFFIALSGCSEQHSDSTAADALDHQKQTAADAPQLASPASEVKDLPAPTRDNPVLRDFMLEVDQYYANLQAETEALYQQVLSFAKAPSATALDNSINTWEQAHNRYLSGRLLKPLFAALIQTDTEDPPGPDSDLRLDAYPLLPGYLDTVSGYPFSGLIHSEIPLTLANMYQEFQLGDPAYVTLGFHALEVMLKGTDKEREISEFAKLTALQEKNEADPELRRTLYCSLLAEQIRQDILQLPARWRQNIKDLLNNLDEAQSRSLKARLLKMIDEQNEEQAQADEHFNQLALDMKQDLLKRIRLSLDK